MEDINLAEPSNLTTHNGKSFVKMKGVDCTAAFTTNRVFITRDELLSWARNVGKSVGCVVVIFRSDDGQSSKKVFVSLACEKSEVYKPYNHVVPAKSSRSEKCMCPFRLKGKLVKGAGGWVVKVICGFHNHKLSKNLGGNPYNARQRVRSSLRPSLKQECMQQLVNLMHRDRYICWCRRGNDEAITDLCWAHPNSLKLINSFNRVVLIESTYIATRYMMPLVEVVGVTSTSLTFSVMFAFLDSEKDNSYTWLMKILRSVFVSPDDLPRVIVTDGVPPLMKAVASVFPTPMTHNLLCQFYIRKNVRDANTCVYSIKKVDSMMNAFDCLINAPKKDDYQKRLSYFEFVSTLFHKEKFVCAWIDSLMHLGNTTNRVESAHWRLKSLLMNNSGDLSSCWEAMNNMIWLQNTEIKTTFDESIGRLQHRHNKAIFKNLNGFVSRTALGIMVEEIERVNSVGDDNSTCGCVLRYTHGLPCACELTRYTTYSIPIPLNAIDIHWKILCFIEHDYSLDIDEDQLDLIKFEIIWEKTAQILKELDSEGKRQMHDYSLDIDEDQLDLIKFEIIWEKTAQILKELDSEGKRQMLTKIREIINGYIPSMGPPITKTSTCGASQKGKRKGSKEDTSTEHDPSCSEHVDALPVRHVTFKRSVPPPAKRPAPAKRFAPQSPYLQYFPFRIQPFIARIDHVAADGKCLFKRVAALLSRAENSWPLIRLELIEELKANRLLYVDILNGSENLDALISSLWCVDRLCPKEKWMSMPGTGYVIANRYKVVVVYIDQRGSSTIFPLTHAPPSGINHPIVSIGYIASIKHLVQINLTHNAPIPPPDVQWNLFKSNCAKAWEDLYRSRIQQWKALHLGAPS